MKVKYRIYSVSQLGTKYVKFICPPKKWWYSIRKKSRQINAHVEHFVGKLLTEGSCMDEICSINNISLFILRTLIILEVKEVKLHQMF